MTEHTRLFFTHLLFARLLVVSMLAVGGAGLSGIVRAQESPMSAPVYPVEDDEPEAAQNPADPAPVSPAPASPALSSAERLKIVTAPLPPVRPWSVTPPGAAPAPGAAPVSPATPPAASSPPAAPTPAASTAVPVDAPLPPRRPGSPPPASPEPEPGITAPDSAAPATARLPTLGGPERDFPMSVEPDMRVVFAPPIAVPSTTEEIEAEEERTPEPTLVEKQTDAVDIACIRPEVMGIVRAAGEYFGATPVVTSGQRDRGRRGSYHRQCMAADFFLPGIERARLAKYLRAQAGAGGVGTYCSTKSVHIDIGDPRNWYQCGRRFRFAQR